MGGGWLVVWKLSGTPNVLCLTYVESITGRGRVNCIVKSLNYVCTHSLLWIEHITALHG